ncbi:septal ring lytic transglycosylase RlpA family protein [Leptolyngbya sp. KIOST-1]|uniref:septal ring lytic transglycosylase RlpA family protein n=1 Tax=Leptolyngbya sp. KIOST-1 TaxID=1229172 RepID=UPI00056D0742|nr:septal ring lytic transglycosylase RlpA family protein [Leptolyngbya sp. KIOST-1]
MKHSVLGGLTVAVAMSVFGAPLPSQAQDSGNSGLSLDAEAEYHAEVLSRSDSPDAGPPADSVPSNLEPAKPESGLLPQSDDNENSALDTATVFPHALDARQAATVYIRSIPVITLVGGELETLNASQDKVATPQDAQVLVERANEILARLQDLADEGDATAIEARWEKEAETFVVAWGDETLLTVDDDAILPDTTANPGEDALQMANRLRRLLGDAPPLARIEGLPEPVTPTNRLGVVSATLTGMASWYGPGFHGRQSASGEVFNQNALTAAHRTLPFGTQVRVTNLSTGQSVVVRINDRGPFSGGRVIDLSAAAASQIGLRASGVGRVQIDVLSP